MPVRASGKAMDEIIRSVLDDTLASIEQADPVADAARLSRAFIIARSRKGIDRFGNRFRPYKKRTAARKGRRSPVDLTDRSPHMLDALNVEIFGSYKTGRRADVRFFDKREENVARHHIFGTIYMATRDFFGLTPREEQEVSQMFMTTVRHRIPRSRRFRFRLKLMTL